MATSNIIINRLYATPLPFHLPDTSDQTDSWRDFWTSESFHGIGIGIEVARTDGKRRRVSRSLIIRILDTDTADKVAERTVSVCLEKEEPFHEYQFAISLGKGQLCGARRLTVSVITVGDECESLCYMRLVDRREMASLLKPTKGWVSLKGISLKAVHDTGYSEQVSLVTHFDYDRSVAEESLPAVTAEIRTPDGQRDTIKVRPDVHFFSDFISVTVPVRLDTTCRGQLRVVLTALDLHIATFLVEVGYNYRIGEFGPEGLAELPVGISDLDLVVEAEKRNGFYDEPLPLAASRPATDTGDACGASARLERMVGLAGVKAKVQTYTSLVNFNMMRQREGMAGTMPPLHCLFLGSPGTGKTTVARLLGELLHKAGVLSKGHVVVHERSTLIGRYYGTEEEKVREALEEAKGGILLIDEAYQLYRPDDPKDPGRLVIESLMTALADTSDRDWMLILAGYTEPMKRLFEVNPGLASRIPTSNHYLFDDYSPAELMEIADRYLVDNDYRLAPEARTCLQTRLQTDYDLRDEQFGNARHVINLIETGIIPAMALRVSRLESADREALQLVTAADIPAPTPVLRVRPPRMGFVS